MLHGFAEPPQIRGKAIVWLDVPWCRDDPRTAETGPAQGRPRYTNDAEAAALARFLASLRREVPGAAELAVLSPYNQQASLLRRRMRKAALPEGLELKPALNARPGAPGGASGVHTVDSFQGNQADVIAVSLVRNNLHDPGHGLGFLDDASRLNVLLSRAERLLVLVGSWDFFQEQVRTVELDDAANPLWHLKRIVADLGDWFGSGRAVRLGADLGGLVMIVLLPVSRFRVPYDLARGKPYSRLEHMVLNAVADGGATLRSLADAFRVHDRLLVEAVVTLVNAGWVAVQGGPQASFVLTGAGHAAASGDREPVSVIVETPAPASW